MPPTEVVTALQDTDRPLKPFVVRLVALQGLHCHETQALDVNVLLDVEYADVAIQLLLTLLLLLTQYVLGQASSCGALGD